MYSFLLAFFICYLLTLLSNCSFCNLFIFQIYVWILFLLRFLAFNAQTYHLNKGGYFQTAFIGLLGLSAGLHKKKTLRLKFG